MTSCCCYSDSCWRCCCCCCCSGLSATSSPAYSCPPFIPISFSSFSFRFSCIPSRPVPVANGSQRDSHAFALLRRAQHPRRRREAVPAAESAATAAAVLTAAAVVAAAAPASPPLPPVPLSPFPFPSPLPGPFPPGAAAAAARAAAAAAAAAGLRRSCFQPKRVSQRWLTPRRAGTLLLRLYRVYIPLFLFRDASCSPYFMVQQVD